MFGSSGGMFGNKSFTSNTSSFGSTFGTTTFGSNDGPDGTTIAFEPMRGTDTMIRNGDNKEIQTKNMCITSMDQYKMKSIEELRVADYAANRKGNTGGGGGGGMFVSAAKPAGTGLFGSTASTFGQQQQPTNTASTGTSLFGNSAKPAGSFGGKDDENAIKRAILESQLSLLPYGDSPIFKNKSALPGISSSSVLSRNDESSNIQAQLRKLANQALSPTSSPSNNTSSNGNTSAKWFLFSMLFMLFIIPSSAQYSFVKGDDKYIIELFDNHTALLIQLVNHTTLLTAAVEQLVNRTTLLTDAVEQLVNRTNLLTAAVEKFEPNPFSTCAQLAFTIISVLIGVLGIVYTFWKKAPEDVINVGWMILCALVFLFCVAVIIYFFADELLILCKPYYYYYWKHI